MTGQAFQFVPGLGAVALEEATPAGQVIGAGDAIAALREQVNAKERERGNAPGAQRSVGQPPVSAPLKRRTLVCQIRDRLRVVEAELRAKKRLEAERDELKRLLAAARRPPAGVTPITSARKSG